MLNRFRTGSKRSMTSKFNNSRSRRAASVLQLELLEKREMFAVDQTFAVIGDYGANTPGEAAVANMVKSWSPAAILTTGDNNYDLGGADTIDANVGKYYHNYIGNYTGAYGASAATNQFFPSLGRHDWLAPGATPYLNYFTLPGNERYYDYVIGSVHFFALDAAPDEPDGRTSTSIQGQWLQSKLAAAPEPFKVVYFSFPPYSSGVDVGSDATMQWPFQSWGADVVLSGHAHDYERLNENGMPYIVNGLGGEDNAGLTVPVAGSLVRYNSNFGAMKVVANAANLSLQFYSIDSGGTLIDSLNISKVAPANVFASAGLLAGSNVIASGSNTAATVQLGEPANAGVAGGHSVWWNWTAPSSGSFSLSTAGSSFDTTLGVYTGSTVNTLTTVAGNNDESASLRTSALTFNAIAGTTYHFSVDGVNGASGKARLALNQLNPPPANDNFASAAVLSGASATATGSNINATSQAGEPANAGATGGHSLWWTWTAAATGTTMISTAGSTFDTTLGVYTGAAVNALTVVASNDDESSSIITSKVSFKAMAGQTYRISVDGYHNAAGSIALALTASSGAPANDNFASAAILTGVSSTATGSNLDATLETGEPGNAGTTGGHSLWWTWTAPSSGSTTVTTAGSSFDTTLGIYTGAAVNALVAIASNDDENGAIGLTTSKAVFSAVAGTTYRISVDGYKGATGAINLALSEFTAAPINDSFAAAIALSGTNVTTIGTNVNATMEAGEISNAGVAGGRSVWWTWTAPQAGSVTISTAGSSFDTTLGVYTGTAVNALALVASNDDENPATGLNTSRVTFSAVAGVTYRICVDGYRGLSGDISLSLQLI